MSVFEYSNKVTAMRPSIIRELLKQMADPQLISFAGGNPAPEAFPSEAICNISDELLRNEAPTTLQYSITEGYPALIEQSKLYLSRQWPLIKEYDGVMVTSGSQQVMDFMSKLLCNEGDTVVCDDPAFLGALNSFRSNGAQLIGVSIDAEGPNIAQLEAALSQKPKPKFFYTIPNFQNPTGYTTSLQRRREIYELCKKYNVPILEDNPYGELRFTGQDIPPIKMLDEEGIVVYAASMSKIFAPGMRVAFCLAPKELLAKMTVLKQGNDVHTPLWSQRVIARYFETQDYDAHIKRLQGIYGAKAQHMMRTFEDVLKGDISYLPVQGGMFMWLTLPEYADMPTFVKKCLEQKLALVPGNAFFVEDSTPCQSVRVNFSSPSAEQIDKGVTIMRSVLDEMKG